MSILEKVSRFCVFSSLLIVSAGEVKASPTSSLMQWGGDTSTLNRKTHIATLRGNAYVNRENEWVRADSIDLNTQTNFVHAVGRVQYQYGDYLVSADAIDIDMENRTGTIWNGNLSNGMISLRGSRMDQVGENHFIIRDYDYTSCHDCPNSWEVTGKDVDVTLEGYAFIKNFGFKIKDASLFWFPYMILPLKSKRQSGFLFPRWGSNSTYGFYFVEPYFWAINDWSDMTLGVGYYSRRGERYEWEGRYSLTDRSQGSFNLYWTRDKESTNEDIRQSQVPGLYYRYAVKGAVTQELPWGFEGKLRLNEVSDSGYPVIFTDDILGRYEPALSSDLSFTKNSTSMSTVVAFRRIRNLLRFDADNDYAYMGGFDPRTVQEVPRIVMTTNDQFWLGQNVATGLEARFNRFTRAAAPTDTINGQEVIREANRLTLIPNLYTTLNPRPWLSVVPSLQYRAYLYNFDTQYSNLARGYPLLQVESSLQLEKTFQSSENPHVTYKHTIRPQVRYSNIPSVQKRADHPFIGQVEAQSPGLYFDNSDIVPISVPHNLETYFTPLGNSLTYGFVTQLIRKEVPEGGGEAKVSRRFELGLNQTFDIHEANRELIGGTADDRIVLSPLFSYLQYGDDHLSMSLQYTYYSFLDRYRLQQNSQILPTAVPHKLYASLAWTWDRKTTDGILQFERSMSLDYSFSKLTNRVSTATFNTHFSINDYIMPRFSISRSFVLRAVSTLSETVGVLVQSPSRCWQLNLAYTNTLDRGSGVQFDFGLNFSGGSYGTFDDALKK